MCSAVTHLDSTRAVSPLRPAEDSVLVDTSELTMAQIIEELYWWSATELGHDRQVRDDLVTRFS